MKTSEEMQFYNSSKRSTNDLYVEQSNSNAENMLFLMFVFGGMAIFIMICIIINCFYKICITASQSGAQPNPLPKRTTWQCNHMPSIINHSSNNWNECPFKTNSFQCSGSPQKSYSANHFGDIATISSVNTHRLNLPTTCVNYTSATMKSWSNTSADHRNSQASNWTNGADGAPPSYEEALAHVFAAGTSTAQLCHHAGAHHDNRAVARTKFLPGLLVFLPGPIFSYL